MLRKTRHAARRARQTLGFANGPRVLLDVVGSVTPWAAKELRYQTSDGATIHCPNIRGARVPVYEVFAEDTYRLDELLATSGEDPVVLDIGGQVGCFSVAIARKAPSATVHAYEASPATARWLSRNIEANGLANRVTLFPVAVSDHAGDLEFLDNGNASGLNGLTASAGAMVTVPCVAFHDAVERAGGRVDLVKIDTEGAEYAIVLGSEPGHWAGVRQVVMEYHDVPGHSWEELQAFFAQAGLTCTRHDPVGPRQGTVWLSRRD